MEYEVADGSFARSGHSAWKGVDLVLATSVALSAVTGDDGRTVCRKGNHDDHSATPVHPTRDVDCVEMTHSLGTFPAPTLESERPFARQIQATFEGGQLRGRGLTIPFDVQMKSEWSRRLERREARAVSTADVML